MILLLNIIGAVTVSGWSTNDSPFLQVGDGTVPPVSSTMGGKYAGRIFYVNNLGSYQNGKKLGHTGMIKDNYKDNNPNNFYSSVIMFIIGKIKSV